MTELMATAVGFAGGIVGGLVGLTILDAARPSWAVDGFPVWAGMLIMLPFAIGFGLLFFAMLGA